MDSDPHIDIITSQYPQCASVATLPQEADEFTTIQDLPKLDTSFACDVLCWAYLHFAVSFSSFSICKLLTDEKSSSLKASLQCLTQDTELQKLGIQLEVGRLKNCNKNPVAEKAVAELEYELKHHSLDGLQITPSDLTIVTATLNKRVRNCGLTAKEIATLVISSTWTINF